MDLKDKIEDLIIDKNYLSAYMQLKRLKKDSDDRIELTGLLIQTLLGELNKGEVKQNQEKRAYYRSLVIELMRDVPGLAPVFKEQLRQSERRGVSALSVLERIRDLSEMAKDPKKFQEEVQFMFKDLGDEVNNALRNDPSEDSVNRFFSKAESSINDGLKQAGSLFNAFTDSIKKDFNSANQSSNSKESKDKEKAKKEDSKDKEKSSDTVSKEDKNVEDAEFEVFEEKE